MARKLIIAGAGHAAGQVVGTLKQKKFDGEIHLVGEEPWLPYQRPPLSKKFLAGELPAERLYVKPESFYEDPAIHLHLGLHVEHIDREAKTIVCDNSETLSYDELVLALGAGARRLHLPGSDLAGVHYLRTIQDVIHIQEDMREGSRLVIVGAGYIGLEVAAVTRSLGLDVTVVEMQDRVMKRVVSEEVSAFYDKVHRKHGVEILLNTGLERFEGDERVQSLRLSDGRQLPADLVVIGIGIEPNTALAADAGLEVRNGIVVDEHCRTGDASVYAVGDCTYHPNPLLGRSVRLESVHNALEQARTAAANICGEDVRYADVPWFWSDQYDLKLQIAGLSEGYDRTVLRGDPEAQSFSCIYLADGRIIAVDAINRPRDFMQAKPLIAKAVKVDAERLADPGVELKSLAGA